MSFKKICIIIFVKLKNVDNVIYVFYTIIYISDVRNILNKIFTRVHKDQLACILLILKHR